jgi:hypothetical protein
MANVEVIEVIVVDDGSPAPVALPGHDRLRCIRLNDDRLLPRMAEVCVSALASTTLALPVAAISGIEVVDGHGPVLDRRLTPTYTHVRHFSLEPLPEGRSHVTENTLVVDRRLLLALGGFDTGLAACEWIDLFLRLNPVCSILELDTVTYRLTQDSTPHFSRNCGKRRRGFQQLVAKHRDLFASHRERHADALVGKVRMQLAAGAAGPAIGGILAAFGVAPRHAFAVITSPARVVRLVRNLRSLG